MPDKNGQLTEQDAIHTMTAAAHDSWERMRKSGASQDQYLTFVGLTDEEVAALAVVVDGLVRDDPVEEMLADFHPRVEMMTALADFLVAAADARAADKDEEVTLVSLRPGEK